MNRTKKAAIAVWHFTLLTVIADAFIEFEYPTTNYFPGPGLQIAELFSVGLFLGTGIPLLVYLWKRNPSRTGATLLVAVLLVSTVLLAGVLVPNAWASAENRAKVQWYNADLNSQGFKVIDVGQYSYHHGGNGTQLHSYAEVISTAKNVNCTTIYLHTGTPTSFAFFMQNEFQMVFYSSTAGEYLYFHTSQTIASIKG